MPELQLVADAPANSDMPQSQTAAPHPEEMNAEVSFRIGDMAEFRARARCTPAGLVTGGLASSAILLASAYLVRACRGR